MSVALTSDKRSAYQKRYRLKYRDKIRELQRKYYATNRIRLLEQKREYHALNKDRLNARHKAYRATNKDRVAKQRRIRYYKYRGARLKKNREYYMANRVRLLKQVKTYYKNNRDEKLVYAKAYRQTNSARIRIKDKTRYFERYGITKSQFEELSRKQKFCCALCLRKRRLFVDHDHECHHRSPSAVRGLLCGGCNSALGNLGDNIVGLRRAISYLQRARPFQTHKKESV